MDETTSTASSVRTTRKPVVTYTAEQIPGTNSYRGKVWCDGAAKCCNHKHGGFTSAKACADLPALVRGGDGRA